MATTAAHENASAAEDVAGDVELGPFFTSGVVLIAYGLFRRRPLAVATGLGAIWLDQRSELGRSLTRRVRNAAKAQIKAHAPSASAVDEHH